MYISTIPKIYYTRIMTKQTQKGTEPGSKGKPRFMRLAGSELQHQQSKQSPNTWSQNSCRTATQHATWARWWGTPEAHLCPLPVEYDVLMALFPGEAVGWCYSSDCKERLQQQGQPVVHRVGNFDFFVTPKEHRLIVNILQLNAGTVQDKMFWTTRVITVICLSTDSWE